MPDLLQAKSRALSGTAEHALLHASLLLEQEKKTLGWKLETEAEASQVSVCLSPALPEELLTVKETRNHEPSL